MRDDRLMQDMDGGSGLSKALSRDPNARQHVRDAVAAAAPIDMVLHCPACRYQHIDAPDTDYDPHYEGHMIWHNPPHRSHLCKACGHIWRPADVCTNGVAAVKTKGTADSPIR